MNHFKFAFLVRAFIISTAIFRIAIFNEFRSKSCVDIRKTIGKIHHKIIKQEHTTNPNHVKKLLRCGDIATYPGPAVESYTDTLNNLRTQKENLKTFPVNAQSIRQQRLQLKKTLDDLGPSTFTAITETWLNDTMEKTRWQLADHIQFLRSVHWKSFKLKGGGVILIVQAWFTIKTLKDLAESLDENQMEHIWIELAAKSWKNHIAVVAYNPVKKHTNNFLELLNFTIDRRIAENRNITIMGDFSVNYSSPTEQMNMIWVFAPYILNPANTKQPARFLRTTSPLLDHFITNKLISSQYKIDTLLYSDHSGHIAVLDNVVTMEQTVKIKVRHDKKTLKCQWDQAWLDKRRLE